jgi:hypothetical protein
MKSRIFSPFAALPVLTAMMLVLLLCGSALAFAQATKKSNDPAAKKEKTATPAAKGAAAAPVPPPPDMPVFEGVVLFKKGSAANKLSSNVTMYIKGDRFMADEKGEKIQQKIIVDAPKNAIYMVMDKEKMIMEMPMEKASAKVSEARLPTKTTKTQKIAGYDCEQWIDKHGGGEVELWTNNQIGRIVIPEGPMGAGLLPSAAMQRLLKQGNYFPFLMVERDRTGKEITRLEVTSVEKKPVEDTVFATPTGYQKMEMPGSEK